MSKSKICRYCGNVIPKDAQTCEYCGKYLYKPQDHSGLCCAKCKAPVNDDDNFCQYCGAIFNLAFSKKEDEEVEVQHNIANIHYNIGIFLSSLIISSILAFLAASGKETTIIQNCIFWGISFVVMEIALYIYLLPSIIAIENNHPNTYTVYICNLLLGITVIGWFVALVFAFNSKPKE